MILQKICCFFLIAITVSACQPVKAPRKPGLVFPGQSDSFPPWSEAERKKGIAVRGMYRDEWVSTHLIRLAENEPPHYHDHHSLVVSVISGKSVIHFKTHAVPLTPGDVVFVPPGTFHWAENQGDEASVVFAVFSPAFSGKDRRLASPN
jgi:mannose-6-phosphate isomerase-like protein (cupin superfamily)